MELTKRDGGKFDVCIITQNNPNVPDPWFGRIRTMLSQVFFRNDCNAVHPDQLTLLFMASRWEKINWGMLVDRNAVQQIRWHVQSDKYESPVAPFLILYIGHFLEHYQIAHSPWPMGSFLDVQREIANTARNDPTVPNPDKRPRIEGRYTAEGYNVKVASTSAAMNLGPCAKKYDEERRTMEACVEEMFNFLHTTEQQQQAAEAKFKEREACQKRHATQALQNAQTPARKNVEALREEFRLQEQQLQGKVTSLHTQLETRDLELQEATEKNRNQEDQSVKDRERIQKLEDQTSELFQKCKALTPELALRPTAQPTHLVDMDKMQRLQRETDNAKENFEANKVAWTHNAVKIIATTAYQLLLATPPTSATPPTTFLDQCMDESLAALELDFSDNN